MGLQEKCGRRVQQRDRCRGDGRGGGVPPDPEVAACHRNMTCACVADRRRAQTPTLGDACGTPQHAPPLQHTEAYGPSLASHLARNESLSVKSFQFHSLSARSDPGRTCKLHTSTNRLPQSGTPSWGAQSEPWRPRGGALHGARRYRSRRSTALAPH